ncbi:vacuolar fusion protein CCZ1 homolog [Stegostoma tigrinum]|uniref:vacuolar fusion protein CCZ1 homolog n=1 Tax=Stegostoma tigrinum TaxID=3053191 RepID=UPI0028701449|nr:vacuolar fusion protein CCZ1 homolog [Stegostoma tigrinum]
MLMTSPRMTTAQEKQYPPSLLSFFIYNPKFGPREGEEEKKILFYHPSDVDKNEKIRNVGLCEAIVQFTRTFCPTKPAKSLHTQKNRQFFHEAEENFWMVMVVSNPMIEKLNKDGTRVPEYQEDELLDTVYGAVIQQCYCMYKLFNGTFAKSLEAGGVEHLQQRIQKFFYRLWEGYESLSEVAEEIYWNSTRDEALHLCGETGEATLILFLTGPYDINNPDLVVRFPRIFVNTDTTYEELHLIVYKAMSAVVCFLINASVELTREFCQRLDNLVGPQLTLLASDICEQFNTNKRLSAPEKEPHFKFIYFNHMNLAEKTTIHMRKTASMSLTSVHTDLMKILGDINSDFSRAEEDEEIIVKAMTDYWVVGKKSDQRELYVILSQKNANLIEVNEEVKKLCATQFSNIFFLD